MFPLKLRMTERPTKEFNVMRDEDRTGTVVVEFEQVFPLTLYTEKHHSSFTEFLDRYADGVWSLITSETTNFHFYDIILCIYTSISFNHHVAILRPLKYIKTEITISRLIMGRQALISIFSFRICNPKHNPRTNFAFVILVCMCFNGLAMATWWLKRSAARVYRLYIVQIEISCIESN